MKAAFALMLSACTVVSAQEARFKTRVEAVRLDALVTNGNRAVGGLTTADFELRDSNVVQTIESVAIADLPISLMIALDISASVAGTTLERLQEGVALALAKLEPRDRAALVTFSAELRATPWSNNASDLTAVMQHVRAGGGTALWDAVFTALTLRDDTPSLRRLVMVFSDGDDTASWLPRNSVLAKANRTDAVVYTVAIRSTSTGIDRSLRARSGIELSSDDVRAWRETPFLIELADSTGGSAIEIDNSNDLRDAFSRILSEFRTRYVITYTPQGVDAAGWHPIEVKLKGKRGTVQARRGYFR